MAKISAYTEDTTPDREAYVIIAIGGANYKVKIQNITTLMGGPQGSGDNYEITTSVATNDLTVALKTLAGADPSAADPIKVRIGNTVQTITAALSTTKNDGTNWCNAGGSELATKDVDFFVYLIQETGANAGTKIGFSRIPSARVMSDFVNTNTDEKYIAGSWTNFNATDEVENIGRFNATLSATATFQWSLPATSIIISRPIFETRWLIWAPTVVGFNPDPTFFARYQLTMDTMKINFWHAAGTSDTTTYTLTMPFIVKNVANNFQYFTIGYVTNNSVTVGPGNGFGTPNSNLLNLYPGVLSSAWTAANNKNAGFQAFIEI